MNLLLPFILLFSHLINVVLGQGFLDRIFGRLAERTRRIVISCSPYYPTLDAIIIRYIIQLILQKKSKIIKNSLISGDVINDRQMFVVLSIHMLSHMSYR